MAMSAEDVRDGAKAMALIFKGRDPKMTFEAIRLYETFANAMNYPNGGGENVGKGAMIPTDQYDCDVGAGILQSMLKVADSRGWTAPL